jgi:hypothetical protein
MADRTASEQIVIDRQSVAQSRVAYRAADLASGAPIDLRDDANKAAADDALYWWELTVGSAAGLPIILSVDGRAIRRT